MKKHKLLLGAIALVVFGALGFIVSNAVFDSSILCGKNKDDLLRPACEKITGYKGS